MTFEQFGMLTDEERGKIIEREMCRINTLSGKTD